MKKGLNIKEAVRMHIARCYKTQTKAAAAWAVSPNFVSQVVRGKAAPTQAMLTEMGIARVQDPVRYEKIKGGNHG